MAETAQIRGPAITFAIPYYSNAEYLLEAISSVRAQTIDDWELLVVDDAGPEPAADLVAALTDRRIRYIRNPTNLGLAGNWNACVGLAAAPMVTLLHADDRLRPDYAATVLAAARQSPTAAAVFTDVAIIGADGAPARSLPDLVKRFARRPSHNHDVVGDAGLAGILANNYVMCPTLCYRKDVVGDAPFDGRWKFVLDLDHATRLLLAGHRLRGVRMVLYDYRRHSENQTSTLTADARRFAEEIELYRSIERSAATVGFTRTAKAARHRSMVRVHLALRAAIDLAHRHVQPARVKAVMLWADLRHRPLDTA